MSSPGLRSMWKPLALKQLERLAKRAPAQAIAVFHAVDWLAARPGLADLGRADPSGRRHRYWAVPPQGIFYTVVGSRLWVLEVRDAAVGGRPGEPAARCRTPRPV